MISGILAGDWNQLRGDVKMFFSRLTDDDLSQIGGNEDKALMMLQERYGYTREQAQAEWDKFIRQYANVPHGVAEDAGKKINKTGADRKSRK